MNATPILLLTGYLGSGKTTLVNRILSNKKGIKFAVIVNDIGEVNIDASLIAKDGIVGKKDESLVALQNGCICCTLKMDLIEQIADITNTGKFDYIVIEASGICEPEPIARTICSIPMMGEEYFKGSAAALDCIVTVVDAKRLKDEFSCAKDLLRGNLGEDDLESLVIQQIEFCNIIVLNKVSLVSGEELGTLRAIIRQLQPKAEILECDWAEVELEKILDTGLFNYDQVSGSATWISELEGHSTACPDPESDHDGHHHHEHNEEEGEAEEYGISTFVYCARPPFDINKFDYFVAKHWPKGVIRTKGMCYFTDDTDQCYLFEQAGSQVSLKNVGQWYATMPEDQLQQTLAEDPVLQRDWDPVYGDRMQKLVFIGQHMDREEIEAELDFCLVENFEK